LVDRARARIDELERRWSRFLADSELCRLNRAAGSPVLVSAETFDLVALAVAAWHRTEGLFDPTVLSAMVANGYDRSFDLLADGADDRVSVPDRPAPGCGGIDLDRTLGAVTLPPGVGLDLGGIAKGRAADLVAGELLEAGAAGVCVNLGGDLRVAGSGPGTDGWVVGIDDPFDLGTTAWTIALARGAVVTSARTRRRWRASGADRHHLVDPATGGPADSGVAAVTVVGAEAADAEVLAKTALIAGAEAGATLLVEAGMPALITRDDGAVTRLGHWQQYER
jgi:thiamine biosynthesis lipoprotein